MTSELHSRRHLFLGTLSFTICFAAWGLVGAFAPRFRQTFHLSATQTALLVAVPVLLGSLPMGMLTDRFGGRAVFAALMAFAAIPLALVPAATSYRELLLIAFFAGMAGSSFAIGVGYVSRWTAADKQGTTLGVFGLGNIGQSAAVFLGPVLAASLGWQAIFRGMAAILIVSAVVFALTARNAPSAGKRSGVAEMLAVLRRERLAWVLSLFYFLTFGGFVAFSIYLPTLLKDQFRLSPTDAGFRAAGFVVLATLMRPVGGWLADRIGGARVLSGVFLGVVPFGLLLTWPAMLPFSVGALGCAGLLGVGNGAVFKLVPQYFPGQTGTVTGLVGAMGGLGGFFPPLVLGIFRDRFGAVWPGFLLLTATAFCLYLVNRRVFVPRQEAIELTLPPEWTRAADQVRAGAWATLATAIVAAAIVVGSRNLQNFDPSLVIYTFACIFATWGVAYHYGVWLQKPPTRLFWRRGWQIARRRGALRSGAELLRLAVTHLAAQTFIARRSRLRWWMHQFLFWGCLLAAAITFPLVFGWIYFRTPAQAPTTYVTYLFGFPVGSFRLRTIAAWTIFHGLDIAAILVLAGIALALWRRMRDRGAIAVQVFARDFFPLILLFAISVTGLALTASSLWMRGAFYDFLAILHAITVVAALLYLPFGKFFHIFQRPAQLGVKLYQRAGDEGEGAICARCGERFASRMQVDDLKAILPQLGFDYGLNAVAETGVSQSPSRAAANWQELCPACKRKSLASAQRRLKEAARG
jgi:NNP family nitrate/nitrite transporter-like MFS transporter